MADMFPSFLQSRWWSTNAPLRRRSISDRTGPWLGLINEEDWEYDCRTAALGAKLAYCNEFLAEVRSHDGERASKGGTIDRQKLSHRAIAHKHICNMPFATASAGRSRKCAILRANCSCWRVSAGPRN